MTQIKWKDNSHSGAFVERQLRSLEAYINNCQDGATKLQELKDYVYVWNLKSQIIERDSSKELEKRIEELERLAGIAQSGVIAK